MAAATLRCSPSRPPRQASSFELLGGELSSYHLAGDSLAPAAFDNVLDELTVKYCQNRSPRREGEDRSFKLESTAVQEIPSPTLNINPRGSRHRRPQIQQETFEPLEVVREEPSWFSNENSTLLSAHHGAEKQHFSPPRQATPLGGDVLLVPELNQPKVLGDKMELVFSEPPSYQSTPLKAPYTVEVLDHAVSPALSIISDQGSSFMEGSPRGDAHSVPRIEDSLEQLDKLEEDLEAFGAVAAGRRAASPEKKLLSTNGPKSKRASVAGRAATVRIKSSEQARPALRRSSSLAFHETHTDQPDSMVEQKAHASLSRSRSTNLRSTAAKNATFKSTKPATVPNFELPGEAVARRLREQREARLAKQADAQKAPRAPAPALAPPKLKPHQPLTRPTFELPGEAISRKKREEREARLRAQEEEERKRREFKARPMRTISNPSTFVRETVTSRARQGKPQPAAVTNKQDEANQAKRMSGSFNRTQAHPVLVNSSPLSRGRNSMTLASNDLSRATSTSTGSASGKRSTLSAEEAAQLKLRGRDVFTRDNSFSRDLEREKREREAVTKSARELAAERSRAASREWAEKRRQRELAMREPAKACGQ